MFSITAKLSVLISCRKYILKGKNGYVVNPSQLDSEWKLNQSKPNLNEDLKPASRFETQEMLQQAFQLTRNVTFDQSYLDGHDATIILKKVQE